MSEPQPPQDPLAAAATPPPPSWPPPAWPPPANPQPEYPPPNLPPPAWPPPGVPSTPSGVVPSPVLYRGAPSNLVSAVEAGAPVVPARWGFPDFLITFALWLFLSVAAALVVLALGGTPTGKSIGVLIAISLPWLGLAGWPILVAFWRGNGPVLDFGLTHRWSDLWWGLLYGVVALVLAGAVAVGTQALFGEFDSSAGELANELPQLWAVAIFGLLVGIGAPIVEELAYRGLLLGSLLKRNLAPWLAIGIAALLFSLTHFEPIRIPLLLSTGIVLGIARYHRRSTTTSIVAHMTNNIPAALALLLT